MVLSNLIIIIYLYTVIWLVVWLFCFVVYQPFLSHLVPNEISNNSVWYKYS